MRKIVLALLLLATPAFAQQPTTAHQLQACNSALFEDIQRDLNVRAQAFSYAEQVAKLKEEIKALKDKYEPEKKD